MLEIIRQAIEKNQTIARSHWEKGVYDYALELLDTDSEDLELAIEKGDRETIKEILLNGAASWSDYSWGGCSLIYDSDICDPSEQKRTDYGRLRPNKNEEWLDTQARALYQAMWKIFRTLKEQGI